MPIYMDRHDVSEAVTAENVAQLHQADLKIQHKFNCRGLTYWFDEKRKTAFCLVEAPNEKTMQEMHNHAHGVLSHQIIEVEASIVESFLGRIEDPEKAQNTDLNIINDPAFRTIMVIRIERHSFKHDNVFYSNDSFRKYTKSIIKILSNCTGRIVKQQDNYFLVSFESVTNAVLSALKISSEWKQFSSETDVVNIDLKIGLAAGVPVTDKESIFEETIKLAERMCHVVDAEIIISSEVKDLYKSENLNSFVNGDRILTLTISDEKFLTELLDYTENVWDNTALKVEDFSKNMGYSKSQLYRKMVELTGKSPNTFIKEYRLNQALNLLNKRIDNISEIAYETGFSSPSYFSKCFLRRYGCLPSEYIAVGVM